MYTFHEYEIYLPPLINYNWSAPQQKALSEFPMNDPLNQGCFDPRFRQV